MATQLALLDGVGESPAWHPHSPRHCQLCPLSLCRGTEHQCSSAERMWWAAADSLAQHCPPTLGACLHGKAVTKINLLWHKQVQQHQLQLHYIRMHQLWILWLWSFGVTLATKLISVSLDKVFYLYPQNGARPRHITFSEKKKKPQQVFLLIIIQSLLINNQSTEPWLFQNSKSDTKNVAVKKPVSISH